MLIAVISLSLAVGNLSMVNELTSCYTTAVSGSGLSTCYFAALNGTLNKG